MNILGIETSCDETAVAIVNDRREILANIVLSQIEDHEMFGGVVPEIAARAHMQHLTPMVSQALKKSDLTFDDLDGIAATTGPGLIGGVMVGMMTAKAIASARNLPFIAVNHLEAHALTPRLTDDIEFPYLILLVSGGHTQFLVAEGVGVYHMLGTTIDDALGECFDKSAKMMGLPFPGGPHLEKMADACKAPDAALEKFSLPRPLSDRKNCDFSFSGMKTAVKTHIDALMAENDRNEIKQDDAAALAYAFQNAIVQTVVNRCKNAFEIFKNRYGDNQSTPRHFVVSGGVAANNSLRSALKDLTKGYDLTFSAPPIKLCSDNGVMIAWTGVERMKKGYTDTLDAPARPRWPLTEMAT